MGSPTPVPKYRPLLSAQQIKHIISLCKRDGTNESMRLIADLARIEWQINHNAITPAYVAQPKQSLEDELGFATEPTEEEKKTIVSKESVNDEALYGIWLVEPESLTIAQIKKVRQWRYENNKMTVDEEKLFESEVLGF